MQWAGNKSELKRISTPIFADRRFRLPPWCGWTRWPMPCAASTTPRRGTSVRWCSGEQIHPSINCKCHGLVSIKGFLFYGRESQPLGRYIHGRLSLFLPPRASPFWGRATRGGAGTSTRVDASPCEMHLSWAGHNCFKSFILLLLHIAHISHLTEGFIIKIVFDSISLQALLQGGHPFPHCDDEARLHRRVWGRPRYTNCSLHGIW